MSALPVTYLTYSEIADFLRISRRAVLGVCTRWGVRVDRITHRAPRVPREEFMAAWRRETGRGRV